MKKLTAGIFTVLMGLVTVNAAEAFVASKGYVDEKVSGATADITELEATVAANKLAAEKLVSDYKTENDAKVQANTDAIADNAEAIAANTGLIGDNADAIAANTQAINNEKTARETADTGLDERLQVVEKFSGTGEGSVAKQIADAVAAETSARTAADAELQADIDAINNETTGILAGAKAYADAEDAKIESTIGEVAEGKTVVGMIADAQTQADKGVADAATAQAAANKAQGEVDALEGVVAQVTNDLTNHANHEAEEALAAAKAYADAEDAKIESTIGTVAEGKTVVGMIADAQTAATYNDTEVRGLISAETTARTEADTAINEKIGTVATGETVVGLIADAQAQADKGVEDAATAQAAADAAQETADAAIPAPTGQCQDAANKCVLTYNNAEYAWEVIERATDATLEN